ncbi:MAG: site-2 protease family protein [Puniceicoccales bacterium]|jgi:RIP metalloprotease RseP|nr:site-2 protease family protein [Puniceicoccales bacterium]
MVSVLLSILLFEASIFIHELGHYLAARRQGLFIPRFSIGFGPKLFSWKFRGTEFCLSLLPLGGYVALPQLAELEALEGSYGIPDTCKQQLSAWDRCFVALMGPLFNLLLALFVASVLWIHGTPGLPEDSSRAIGYILPHLPTPLGDIPNPNLGTGLQLGDVILSVDGQAVSCFEAIQQAIGIGSGHDDQGQATVDLEVRRGDAILPLTLHPVKICPFASRSDSLRSLGIAPTSSLKITAIVPDSPAAKAGLQRGDQLLAVDGQTLYSLQHLQDYIQGVPSDIQLSVRRRGEEISLPAALTDVPISKAYWKLEDSRGEEIFCLIPRDSFSSLNSKGIEGRFEIGFSAEQHSPSPLAAGDGLILPANLAVFSDLGEWLSRDRPSSLRFQKSDGSVYEYPLGNYRFQSIAATTIRRLGIECAPEMVWIHLSPWQQIRNYALQSVQTLCSLLSPHSDVALRHLMGPPGIFRTMKTLAAHSLWTLLAFFVMLNVNLAIINLLPLPVLDGGHLIMAGLQKLLGNGFPLRWWQHSQILFILFFLSLMIYASFHDLRRWRDDRREPSTLKFQEQIRLHS